jgi:hypothetical protein
MMQRSGTGTLPKILALVGYGASLLAALLGASFFFVRSPILFSGDIPLTTGKEFDPGGAWIGWFLLVVGTLISAATFGVSRLLQSKGINVKKVVCQLSFITGCLFVSLAAVVITQIVIGVTFSDCTGIPLTCSYFWLCILLWSVLRKRRVRLAAVSAVLATGFGLTFYTFYDKETHAWDSGVPSVINGTRR